MSEGLPLDALDSTRVPLPTPGLEVNDGEDPVDYGKEWDKETNVGLPEEPDGVDDNKDGELDKSDEPCDEDDIVVVALEKVSHSISIQFHAIHCDFLDSVSMFK